MDIIPQIAPRNKPFVLTPAQREEICKRYIVGESTIELAKTYGVTKAAIRSLLITRNIARRENTPELHRTYQCNHAYFNQPLDEERAYWIGFLLADGFISYHKHSTSAPAVGMSLSIVDISHIECFKNALNSNHPIHCYTAKNGYGAGKQMARFVIQSLQLVNAVEQYGVVAHKTKICATPQIPAELMRHMYRGYIDGDGGLSLIHKPFLNAMLEIVGTEAFLNDMALWMIANTGCNPNKPLKSRNTPAIMTLRYGGPHQVSHMLHVLYDDATIYLERKLATTQNIWRAVQEHKSRYRYKYQN